MTLKSTISRSLEYSLHLFGAWPDSSYSMLKVTIWSVVLLIFLIFQFWYCITHIKLNLVETLDGLSLTFSNFLLFFKLIVIWLHKRTFAEILTIMIEDWNNYDSIENKRIMIDKATLSFRISNIVYGFYGIAWLQYIALALKSFDQSQEITPDAKQGRLIVRMGFPFETTVSPRYEIILAIQFIFETLLVYGAAMSIALIISLVLHVGGQIDVLCHKLTETSYVYKKEESQKLYVKDIVLRHQRIIRLTKNIETIFTYISLCQFVLNMLVICFVGFILVISINTDGAFALLMKCFPYYVTVNCEAFVLCYTGEYLTSKSETITKSVYNFIWYELKPTEANVILLILLRSQKQLTITAGKFMNLSLEVFGGMLKASASYVSIFLALYWGSVVSNC